MAKTAHDAKTVMSETMPRATSEVYRARRGRRLRSASVWPAASLLFLTLCACEGVQVGGDALSMNLPPRQAQVCRDAVRDAMAERNVTAEWIRRVHYQAIRSSTRTGSTRLQGFEAWVFPKDGGGTIIVELSTSCRVTRVWARGTR
jgi:hypothetical protein